MAEYKDREHFIPIRRNELVDLLCADRGCRPHDADRFRQFCRLVAATIHFECHQRLEELGKYEHMWGIGRHLLGSQVYDYWADPWGRVHERWADTDRLNARGGSNLLPAHEALGSQWGGPPPEKFIKRICP